jgi:hypothetical protein
MRELARVVSDHDAPQTPRDAAPKAALERGLTLTDTQFEEEELEPPLRQDRDDAEEDVTRSDQFPTLEEGRPVPVAVPAVMERSPMTCAISRMRRRSTTVGVSMMLRRSRTR